jgi:hypothetical protein
VGHVASTRDIRNYHKILVEKFEGERPHGRPKIRWENIRMNLREIGCNMWIGFIWRRIGTSSGLL